MVTPGCRWDWRGLKANISDHGLRNSLLVAPMPTASTAQILGNNECFEPYTSNLYARRTLAGEFLVLNPHLQRQLQRLGLWSGELREEIIAAGGSIQVLTRSMRRAAPVRSYGRSGRTSFLAAPRPALSARLAQSYPTLQGIDAIPEHTRDVFKTAWEMKQRTIIDMAAERGAFIDQSQSLNIFMPVRAPRGRWHRLSPGRGCLCCRESSTTRLGRGSSF